ncbi:hypothetical protein CAPN001_11620 [Capnocytophaga stomatis]|uniref:DUF4373 domain-containing protein n=1 Tax=Capnocytophaga stomatis TaxID=1848904 RepID=UPI00194EE42B|nr:DUF4373 domain-containing protein [Capnocytophaga stomatis]GIJ96593.1 hypothetical protein CAPN001_11620 [Capnocytophaga stomatis]
MARPNKQGLDYFPLDVGVFEDEKMLAISGEFAVKGEIIVFRLLCEIYRNGYFVEFSELLKNKLAKLGGLSGGLVEEVVKQLVKYGFFDGSLFSEYNILTSKNIQKTYLEATKRRKEIDISQFWLLNGVNVNINNTSSGVNVNINPQSKVKESKVNVLLEKEPKVYICDSVEISKDENPNPDLKTQKALSKKVAAKKVFPQITKKADTNALGGDFLKENAKDNEIHYQEEKSEKIKEKRFDFRKALLEAGFDPELSAEWLKIRKAKKAVNSELAFKNFMREVEKSGRSPNEVLAIVVQKQWKGFEASWLHNEQFTINNGQKANTTSNYTKANAGGGYPTGQKISARAFLAKQYSEQLTRNSEAGNITIEVETSPSE